MNSLTSTLITVPTLLNIVGALWLLWWTSRRRGDEEQAETTGHVWDGDLTEYNKPLPRWWLWLFILTVAFGLGYFTVYPSLGNFAGTQKWTSVGQYEAQSKAAEAVIARTFAPFEKASVTELSQDVGAVRVGRNLFLNNCAGCHGSDARGAPGFPNLVDRDWLWGGTPDAVVASIRDGRTGAMPPWQPALGDSGVENVLAYVMSLSGRKLPAGNVEAGKQKFTEVCSACHGADARGNSMLGAPNLTDSTWLHGGALATIRSTIANGRQGQMPAHLERLGETRIKLLAGYVLSLGDVGDNAQPRVVAATSPVTVAAHATAVAASTP
jgi:cytochrome c oxidase cbb3-type subunit 3